MPDTEGGEGTGRGGDKSTKNITIKNYHGKGGRCDWISFIHNISAGAEKLKIDTQVNLLLTELQADQGKFDVSKYQWDGEEEEKISTLTGALKSALVGEAEEVKISMGLGCTFAKLMLALAERFAAQGETEREHATEKCFGLKMQKGEDPTRAGTRLKKIAREQLQSRLEWTEFLETSYKRMLPPQIRNHVISTRAARGKDKVFDLEAWITTAQEFWDNNPQTSEIDESANWLDAKGKSKGGKGKVGKGGKGKGGKGKGGGKGGGKPPGKSDKGAPPAPPTTAFQGTCNLCWAWGHSQRFCPDAAYYRGGPY
jgi:hypothetical protein